jgi:hypothetical protein
MLNRFIMQQDSDGTCRYKMWTRTSDGRALPGPQHVQTLALHGHSTVYMLALQADSAGSGMHVWRMDLTTRIWEYVDTTGEAACTTHLQPVTCVIRRTVSNPVVWCWG